MSSSASTEYSTALLRVLEEPRDPAQFYQTGLPAICRLHSECWKLIIPLLDLPDLMKLMATSNYRVALNVSRNVEIVRWQHSGPFIDLDAFLSSCQLFFRTDSGSVKVKEMLIEASEPRMAVKRPSKPLFFPPSLTSLSLHCAAAFILALPLDLPKILPHLLHLSIKDKHMHLRAPLELQLPPQLQSLSLHTKGSHHILTPEWIAKIPSTLQSLSLGGFSGPGTPRNGELWGPFIWPPSLTHLRLSRAYIVLIENLPRTVTSLELRTLILDTVFPKLENKIVFPWRRFFPHLRHLVLPEIANANHYHIKMLLRTMVKDDVLDASTVDSFIASGFWNLPSLSHLQTPEGRERQPYPLFEKLHIDLNTSNGMKRKDLAIELEALSPLLNFADLGLVPVTNTDTMHYLGITRRLDLKTLPCLPLPPSVTAINVVIMICQNIPSQLLEIACKHLRIPKGVNLSQISLPPNLTSLTVEHHPRGLLAFEILPLALTRLDLELEDLSEWNLIAERLINLRILNVISEDRWRDGQPLAKISSRHLEEFTLNTSNGGIDTNERPLMKEMFSNQPPTLPPSLRILKLRSEVSWHASILTVLPPNLTSLDIDTLAWPDENGRMRSKCFPCVPYPGSEDMNSIAIMRSIPPTLRVLKLQASDTPDFPSLLQYLPPSITTISSASKIDATKVPSPLIPRYLHPIARNKLKINTKKIRPPGFLN